MEQKRYLVFNSFMVMWRDTEEEADLAARLNASCVVDAEKDVIIADYRTAETEYDERG